MVRVLVLVVVLLVRLGTALLLGINRVDVAQEESEDQDGQEDEFVVENEHCDGAKRWCW